ncbi:hypothetical protein [Salmonella enterica]|uniref:hypothetical protein n=1 Tax=Salmonella enterica TaxID=28901 RepID=UPI0002B60C2C|nr:hypothetical protein [Salmonella enterica]CCS30235.1 Putative uncharacterized protein [Salmonella enterica subsp. enterica serovar Agona str. 40.E.08]
MTAQLSNVAIDVSKHPLIKQAYDVCQAIEKCGASPELTDAVTKACALMQGIANAMDSEPVAFIAHYESGLRVGICDADDTVKMEWLRRELNVKPLFTAPPAPVAVPDECPRSIIDDAEEFDSAEEMARTIWTACRAAMQAEPVTAATVPDGWKLVPVEPTEAMMLHKSGCQHHAWDDADCAMRQTRRLVWAHMLAASPAAPEQEV